MELSIQLKYNIKGNFFGIGQINAFHLNVNAYILRIKNWNT